MYQLVPCLGASTFTHCSDDISTTTKQRVMKLGASQMVASVARRTG
jgi:hypothetical protein